MKIIVISLFPKMFDEVFGCSMLWKAQDKNIVSFQAIDLRQFGVGPRKQVDDTPYGGGDGMVLKPEPLFGAINKAKELATDSEVILMTPRGERYSQSTAKILAGSKKDLIFVCGRYEGYDERITALVDRQISIGDYVLTGGEIASMAVIDSVVRLLPGVLGGATSAEEESFKDGVTLEYPQYTRPEEFNGMKVPEVLLSGHHFEIAKWRQKQSKLITDLRNKK